MATAHEGLVGVVCGPVLAFLANGTTAATATDDGCGVEMTATATVGTGAATASGNHDNLAVDEDVAGTATAAVLSTSAGDTHFQFVPRLHREVSLDHGPAASCSRFATTTTGTPQGHIHGCHTAGHGAQLDCLAVGVLRAAQGQVVVAILGVARFFFGIRAAAGLSTARGRRIGALPCAADDTAAAGFAARGAHPLRPAAVRRCAGRFAFSVDTGGVGRAGRGAISFGGTNTTCAEAGLSIDLARLSFNVVVFDGSADALVERTGVPVVDRDRAAQTSFEFQALAFVFFRARVAVIARKIFHKDCDSASSFGVAGPGPTGLLCLFVRTILGLVCGLALALVIAFVQSTRIVIQVAGRTRSQFSTNGVWIKGVLIGRVFGGRGVFHGGDVRRGRVGCADVCTHRIGVRGVGDDLRVGAGPVFGRTASGAE